MPLQVCTMTADTDEWWCALVCRDRNCGVSCGNPSIGGLADRCQQPVQLNRTFRFFGKLNRFPRSESSIGRTFAPWNFSFWEWKWHGTFVPAGLRHKYQNKVQNCLATLSLHLVQSNYIDKKSELMLMRRTTAFNFVCSTAIPSGTAVVRKNVYRSLKSWKIL